MIALLALLACSPSADRPTRQDTLVWAVAFDPGNANPLVAPYALSGMIIDLVQPGLVKRAVSDDGLVYEPDLAESWTWSDDGTALTYTLREGAVWEDGTPITSADVAFTHELIADPAVASNWHGDAKFLAGVDTPDARTVVFRFTEPRNPVLQQGATIRGIVPRHVLGDADRATIRGHASARDPLASGPFTIASWKPEQLVVLEDNPRHPAEPALDRILLKVVPEYSTRLLELQGGEVDLLAGIELADVPTLAADERLRLIREPAASMQYIGYDLADPRFADARLRRALTLGLDREALMRDLLTVEGEVWGRPCVGTVSPLLGDWFASDLEPLPHDLEAAGKLLDEAGWSDTDGDGLRDRDGEPLRFTLMVQNGYAELRRIAVLAQAGWKDLGVALDIETVEPTRFSQRAREHDFDAILWSFGANPKVDPTIQWRSDGQYNWFRYADAETDALIDAGVAATDVAESQAAFREVQRRVHAAQPATFLFWQDQVTAIDRRFQGVDPTPFSVLHHAERWTIEE